ncbi:MAG: DUF2961 domain-containing protein [Pirellulales bacterium]|nr:DUF2961 domain-containing protein [Pirellulales bacterium]
MSRFLPSAKILLTVSLIVTSSLLSFARAAESGKTVAGVQVINYSGGKVIAQDMSGFPLGKWDNNDQFFWTGAKPGDRLELGFDVPKAGRQHFEVMLTRSNDYGIVQFSLDGKDVGGKIDLFTTWTGRTVPIPLGVFDLSAGRHVLGVKIVGTNEKSKGTQFGLDGIAVRPALDLTAPSDPMISAVGKLPWIDQMHHIVGASRCRMFSSYDRTGGNNDGFGGTYSTLWVENGNSVLASMSGPGSIQRIWFTHSIGRRPGLLNLKKEHLKVYIDGQTKPVVDAPLEDILDGKLPRFPKPLVGQGQGGYYCYVPIPYRDGCKVVVEGTGVRFYQITYTEYPESAAKKISSFSMNLSPREKTELDGVVWQWSNLGNVSALRRNKDFQRDFLMDLDVKDMKEGQPRTIVQSLPGESRVVRAVLLEGDAKQLRKAAKASIQFRWNGAEKPAIDLPMEMFFCQAQDAPSYRSLLTGVNDAGWYNFFPMPYQKGEVSITLDQPVKAKLRILTGSNLESIPQGCLHAQYNESLPTNPGVHHPFLRLEGQYGWYVGTYLVTEGKTKRKLPLWLEGDERFTVDGQLDIHGTGSEDYFNCGWYALRGRLNGPGAQPVHGFPVYRLVDDTNQASAFRWHVSDPVPFNKSIVAEIEHGANNKTPANYRSVGFYYSFPPARPGNTNPPSKSP